MKSRDIIISGALVLSAVSWFAFDTNQQLQESQKAVDSLKTQLSVAETQSTENYFCYLDTYRLVNTYIDLGNVLVDHYNGYEVNESEASFNAKKNQANADLENIVNMCGADTL